MARDPRSWPLIAIITLLLASNFSGTLSVWSLSDDSETRAGAAGKSLGKVLLEVQTLRENVAKMLDKLATLEKLVEANKIRVEENETRIKALQEWSEGFGEWRKSWNSYKKRRRKQ